MKHLKTFLIIILCLLLFLSNVSSKRSEQTWGSYNCIETQYGYPKCIFTFNIPGFYIVEPVYAFPQDNKIAVKLIPVVAQGVKNEKSK